MVKSRLISALVASTLIVALLSSCQSSSSESAPPANIIKFSGTASDGQTLDSVSWNFNSDSGAGKIQLQAGTANTYDVQLTLPRGPGTAPVSVIFWRLSIKVGISPVTSGTLGKSTWRDTLGNVLLAKLDSLRRTKDSTAYPNSVQSLVQIYAHALVDGDPIFKGFPTRRVTTLDTAAIYTAAIVYAAGKRIPYTVLSKTWILGLDSATACKLLAKVMAPAGPISVTDSLSLFPPYPVRVTAPVAIGPVNVSGSAVPVSGSFVGDSGLSAYKVRVLQGSHDVSDQFVIATQPTQLDGSQTAWNLATDARLTLQVKSAKVGSYTLEVSVSDKMSRTDTSRIQFAVAPPPDRTGPTITWLAPTKNTLLKNADSILVVKVNVFDASGIDSVQIDGIKAAHSDSGWYLAITVPVRQLGYEIKVTAWDSQKNVTDSVLRVVRESPPLSGLPPKVVRASPLLDTIVNWSSKSILLSWVITSDTMLRKVTLNDSVVAANLGLFQKSVELFVGINTFILAATDARGIIAKDTVRITRQNFIPKPKLVAMPGTVDTVLPKEIQKFTVQWEVSGTSISSVVINGSPVLGNSGVYSREVSLSGDSTWIVLVATDSSGNISRDSIKILRLSPPASSPSGGILVGNQTTTPQFSTNLSGAIISYSLDRSNWVTGNSKLVSGSQIIYLRAKVGSVVSSIDSIIFLYSPEFSLPSGAYTEPQSLVLSAPGLPMIEDSLAGLDGKWAVYSHPLSIGASTKVFARSRLGSLVSDVGSGVYVLPPIPLIAPGLYQNKVDVKFSAPGSDSIQLSQDSKTWLTTTSQILTNSTTIYSRSFLGGIVSSVSATSYTIQHDTSLKSVSVSVGGTIIPVKIDGQGLILSDTLPANTKLVSINVIASDSLAQIAYLPGSSNIALHGDTGSISITVTNGPNSIIYRLKLYAKKSGTFMDIRDWQTYRTVKIGEHWWLAENLKFRNFSGDADTIGVCYKNNTDSCKKYGRLYTWSQSMGLDLSYDTGTWVGVDTNQQGLCPSGWHLPSNQEWLDMLKFVDPADTSACTQLKSTSGWAGPDDGTDVYGFHVLPSGLKIAGSGFSDALYDANYWTATGPGRGSAYYIYFSAGYHAVGTGNRNDKGNSQSIRCIGN